MSTSLLSRRSLVATAAVLPALAVPAVAVAAAAEPDPIFAAIEAHRAANAAWLEALDRGGDINGPPETQIYLRDYHKRDCDP